MGPGKRTSRLARHLSTNDKIIYTETDEAPQLATFSFLPIIQRFLAPAGVKVELGDISLASRIISQFNDRLPKEQQEKDVLKELGDLTHQPYANIIKLPNISASVPQLKEAIAELQSQGYDLPKFIQAPKNDADRENTQRYAKAMGSVVNPVLREGNSDRRVALPVKAFAQAHPHKMMKPYAPDCKASVVHMTSDDFYASEKSAIMSEACSVKIEFVAKDGTVRTLKEPFPIEAGEVIDGSFMNVAALRSFYKKEIETAMDAGMLLSLHLKATMMKVSDPIMFGHCVEVYYNDVFEKHGEVFKELGVNPNNGIGDVYYKIKTLPEAQKAEIEADISKVYDHRPNLAMVDSDRGITNLHVPSDVIIDASMPNVARDGGKMWGPDNKLHEVTCMIPDRCYAGVYAETLKFCKANGAFDPATMGTVNNVGLMAQKAEEYGSHDKTFELEEEGTVRVVNTNDNSVVFQHEVQSGDIWRMCQAKDAPIRDWIRLAVERAKASGYKTIFWLDPNRAHDASILQKVEKYLPEFDTTGLDISIETPEKACQISLARAKEGLDTISVTGNVLRDYLTDLFPILELGTSAKMLSVVPLLAGGGMYETGAGGSAPKHVQQFLKEGHLRWDSLGEFLALAVSLEDLGNKTNSPRAVLLAQTLNEATTMLLENGKSPSRKVKEIDNRGSHFYLALYWSQALSAQTEDMELQAMFKPLCVELEKNEKQIAQELIDCQGKPVDIGGYYKPDHEKLSKAMRPSATFNRIIDSN